MKRYYNSGRVEHHGGTGVGFALGVILSILAFILVSMLLLGGCAVLLL